MGGQFVIMNKRPHEPPLHVRVLQRLIEEQFKIPFDKWTEKTNGFQCKVGNYKKREYNNSTD